MDFLLMAGRRGARQTILALAVGAFLIMAAISFAPSNADAAKGQIRSWGSQGVGNGQFNGPFFFGVEPAEAGGEAHVYVADVTEDFSGLRIQKLKADGTFEASVTLPLVGASSITLYQGIAVDPTLHRFYVMQWEPSSDTANGKTAVERIDVFSTQPEGTTLKPVTGLETIPVPSPTGDAIDEPMDIAVDPHNHDILVSGVNHAGHYVIQRVSSAGLPGARYEEAAGGKLSRESSLSVGPDGTAYILTQHAAEPVELRTLPEDFSGVATPSQGFSEAAAAENWNEVFGVSSFVPEGSPGFGPQSAISADGKTLYFKEYLHASTESTPGDNRIRAYSLVNGVTEAIYGLGTGGACVVGTTAAALGVSGEDLFVLDQGPEGSAPPYGRHVTEFGPGGSGCPSSQFRLALTKSGGGKGTVTSAPAGINCGTECSKQYEEGTAVTLTATAAAGSKFVGWTGCDTAVGTQCNVTMTGGRAVHAEFVVLSAAGVTTLPPQGVTETSAELVGTVDPKGSATTCAFEYVTGSAFESTGFSGATKVPCASSPGSGSGAVPVTVMATGLTKATTYDVRLVATNDGGEAKGGVVKFITAGSAGGGGGGGGGSTGGGGGGSTGGGGGGSTGGGTGGSQGQKPNPTPTKAQLIAKERAAARAKCKKKKGKAKAQCMKKANAIGKPKKKSHK